jgi:hypothetical protein
MAVAGSALSLHPYRLSRAETGERAIAGRLYILCSAPRVSPHGPSIGRGWPTRLLVTPGHYVIRLGPPIVAALTPVDARRDLRIRRCPRRAERIA